MASLWRVAVIGVAVGLALHPNRLSFHTVWRYHIPVVAAWLFLWLAWAATERGTRVVVGLSAMGLVAVSVYLAIVNELWASSALAHYLTYNRSEALSYVAEWLLVLMVPLVGAVLAVWKTTHPQSMTEQRFGQLMWMLAFGLAIGLVVMFWGMNWLFLGAMVMTILGGYAGSSGHRGVTRAVGVALGFAGLAVLPLWGIAISLGCSMQGSCGWSGTEIVANWVGPLLVAASLVGAAISLLFLSTPSKKQVQPTPSPPIPQR